MPIIRSILFWIGFNVSTLVITTLLSVSFVFPFRVRYAISRGWPLFNLWWLRVTCGLKHEVIGLENLSDEPVVIMSKHQSTWETISYQIFLPPMVWVLKRELLWIPIFGWGVAMLNPIAINRSLGKKSIDQLTNQGTKRLNAGINVMIFPEGTRTSVGLKTRYRPGGAILASKAGRRIVPIAHNAGYFWPKHQFYKHPGTIKVVIGPPIETADRSVNDIMSEVEDWIEKTVAELGGVDS